MIDGDNNQTVPRAPDAPPEILSERWRLATLGREQLIQTGFMSVIIGLLYVMFHLLGNTVENVSSRSAFTWMIARWSDNVSYGGADWSFGWLIPPVSLVVLWFKRRELIVAPKAVCQWGLAVIVLALLMHWLGAKVQQTRFSLLALILLLWGVPLYFFGWQVAKLLIFPCTYLIFCVPLTFFDTLMFPLRMFVTSFSIHFANAIGITVYNSGSKIFDAAGAFNFDVADGCSGLRSLLAMMALTAVYAYATQKTLLKQWLLFFAGIPLAMAGNCARIIGIIITSAAFGEKAALTLHDISGYVMFVVSVGLMVGVGVLLNLDVRKQWQRFQGWLRTRENVVADR